MRSFASILRFLAPFLAPFLAAGCAAGAPPDPSSPSPAQSCSAHVVSNRVLQLEDWTVYIEPVQILRLDEGVLLAGTPNYVFRSDENGRVANAVTDSLFGVVVEDGGAVRAIPMPPLEGGVRGIRVSRRPGGGWDAILTEMATANPEEKTVRRVWHGVHDGAAWLSLDTLPLPRGSTFFPLNEPPLLRHGDTLAWAATHLAAGGWKHEPIVFTFDGERWIGEPVPTEVNVSYVALGLGPDGVEMAIVGSDLSDLGPGERDENSLFLMRRTPDWTRSTRLVHGGRTPVHKPVFSGAGNDLSLTWEIIAGAEGQRVIQSVRSLASSLNVGLSLPGSVFAVTDGIQGGSAWIVAEDAPGTNERLAIATWRRGEPVQVSHIVNPFDNFFVATSLSEADLLIFGPDFDGTPGAEALRSRLLHVRLPCGA
ncbi:MAG TPA: hypothetical protein VFT11_00220 [Candidatus Deferrimicrobiaceae bacterium]|nr:hypothetical protein [Candidatus Deferrimicrobiaceae bacterium]